MDLNFDTNTNDHGSGNFNLSIIFLIIGFVFSFAENLTLDVAYKWFFRLLSCISVSLIIYINWDKAIAIFRSKKK